MSKTWRNRAIYTRLETRNGACMWGFVFSDRIMNSSPGLFTKLLTLHASSLVCFVSTVHTGAEGMAFSSKPF